MTRTIPTLSSSGSSRGSIDRLDSALADSWMVGTSPTMTKKETQKLIGVSLEGSVG